jgi:hypothetical protein
MTQSRSRPGAGRTDARARTIDPRVAPADHHRDGLRLEVCGAGRPLLRSLPEAARARGGNVRARGVADRLECVILLVLPHQRHFGWLWRAVSRVSWRGRVTPQLPRVGSAVPACTLGSPSLPPLRPHQHHRAVMEAALAARRVVRSHQSGKRPQVSVFSTRVPGGTRPLMAGGQPVPASKDKVRVWTEPGRATELGWLCSGAEPTLGACCCCCSCCAAAAAAATAAAAAAPLPLSPPAATTGAGTGCGAEAAAATGGGGGAGNSGGSEPTSSGNPSASPARHAGRHTQ